MASPNHSEESHQSKMNRYSLTILRISLRKKQRSRIPFKEGDEVEVVGYESGFFGSYYTATILSSIGASHYRVKYKTLLTDDESALLEDVVKVSQVRPVPPDQNEAVQQHGGFRVYDMVDVFANEGWWFGVIDRIVGEEYYVYFPTTQDNIAYPSHVLRCHHEWLNDNWMLL